MRAGAGEQRFSEHMPHPTKAVDGNHDIFPVLVPTGVFVREGGGEGGEGGERGWQKVSVPWTYSAVQNRTSPTPLSSEADELDEAQYHDRHTLPRSVSPVWVGHAGERRRNPAGHLYGTGE
jgi:hypothetical protein